MIFSFGIWVRMMIWRIRENYLFILCLNECICVLYRCLHADGKTGRGRVWCFPGLMQPELAVPSLYHDVKACLVLPFEFRRRQHCPWYTISTMPKSSFCSCFRGAWTSDEGEAVTSHFSLSVPCLWDWIIWRLFFDVFDNIILDFCLQYTFLHSVSHWFVC